MKNFFSKFFKKEKIVDDQSIDKVVSACISLMVEVSIADQSIDDSEIESLKNTLSEKFNVDQSKISSLIAYGKESQKESTSLYEFTRNTKYCFGFKKK